jgi:pimeloyl-ACP methyl ester carboxylesterase
MGPAISTMAFRCPSSSYDENLPYLEFITRADISCSYYNTYRIPIIHFILDDNLPTMIMCHGNASDIGMENPQAISKLFGVNICLFDYSGYGLHSKKQPSEYDCQQDVVAVYDYLVKTKNVNQKNIIIYGQSLGTGMATYLANYYREHKNKLILVSPLYSASSVVTYFSVPGDIFKNCNLAPNILSPVLILHGDVDNVVPYKCGLDLSLLFTKLYKFVTLKGSSHNDVFTQEYFEEVYNFINNV